jgi:hypothetical protein
VARLGGQSSNSFNDVSHLFETLEDWNDQLKAAGFEPEEFEP